MVMEFCDGGDLHAYLAAHGPLSEPAAQPFFRQIAAALQYLHAHHVAHLDLKPHNVLLVQSAHGSVLKLADFGLSLQLTGADTHRGFRGSPSYTAPEVFAGPFDSRADLWSAGAILFEMLFAAAPYPHTTFDELLVVLAREQEVVLPATPAISDTCRDVLVRLLQYRPADRIAFDTLFAHPFVILQSSLERLAGCTCVIR